MNFTTDSLIRYLDYMRFFRFFVSLQSKSCGIYVSVMNKARYKSKISAFKFLGHLY